MPDEIQELAPERDATANANDAAANSFKTKFAASYGSNAFDWQSILAAILAMLGGCAIPLTPANVKSQIKRPLVQARLRLKFWQMGVPLGKAGRAVDATAAAIEGSTDSEINSWVAAAQEGD